MTPTPTPLDVAVAAINEHADIRLPDGRLAIARDHAIEVLRAALVPANEPDPEWSYHERGSIDPANPPANEPDPGLRAAHGWTQLDSVPEWVAFAVEYVALQLGEDHPTVRSGRRTMAALAAPVPAPEPLDVEALRADHFEEGGWHDRNPMMREACPVCLALLRLETEYKLLAARSTEEK